jgi:hypothetical protein
MIWPAGAGSKTARVNKAVYFFLIPEQVSRDNYAHNALVLAEGLRELGFEIYANINYWRNHPDDSSFLFRHDKSVHPSDCAINVLTYDWMHFINVPPYEILENTKSVRVYLEDAGWLQTPGLRDEFRAFDLVLKSHFNKRCAAPANYRPWAFGLSKRILEATKNIVPFAERRSTLVVNFGATHSYQHQLRKLFEHRVYPKLDGILEMDRTTNSRSNPPRDAYHHFMWEQTAGRHYSDYYERLRTSVACSCVGGQLISALPHDWSVLHGGGRRVQLRTIRYNLFSRLNGGTPRWNQWESWRFWESLTAGCASLMLDFEKYGVELPIQPENWKHYIGFDLDQIEGDLERIIKEPDILRSVADAGRQWALTHYSPAPVARKFLSEIQFHETENSTALPLQPKL